MAMTNPWRQKAQRVQNQIGILQHQLAIYNRNAQTWDAQAQAAMRNASKVIGRQNNTQSWNNAQIQAALRRAMGRR